MTNNKKNRSLILHILTIVLIILAVCLVSCTKQIVDTPRDTADNDTENVSPEDTTGNPNATQTPENSDTTNSDTTNSDTTTVDTTTAIPDTTETTNTPETDAPVTDTPVTDTPVTDTPVTDTPVTDTPVTDTPVTDTPVTDEPIVNTGRPTVTEYPVSASDRVDDSFFADAVFIGDSRTQGIELYSDIKNTTYYAYQGLNVITAKTNNFIVENGQKYTIAQALAKHQEFKKIYICLGVNEYWLNTSTYKHHYEILIDSIMEANPNAAIYMYAIFPLSKEHSKAGNGLNNEHMNEFNQAAFDIAKTRGLYYVNTQEAFIKPDGAAWLDSSESSDGVHLNRDGVNRLTEYLRTHTK